MPTPPDVCAQEILEVVPAVMLAIRAELRRHRTADLSVPQFRTLAFIDRQADASLSDVAEHIGLTLPSMSKIVDGLVTRKFVTRGHARLPGRGSGRVKRSPTRHDCASDGNLAAGVYVAGRGREIN